MIDLHSFAADAFNKLRASRAKRKLALLRPHKTASQSFRMVLCRSYMRAECSPDEYSTTVTAGSLEGRRFISPHLALRQWQELDPGQDWLVAVTLRDPRARLRSAYNYFKGKRGSKPVQVGELLADMSYGGFLASSHPVLVGLKDNVLARFLGGGRFGTETETRNQLYLDEGTTIERAEVAAACAIKTGMVHPLILESPDKSLASLARAMGVARQPGFGWKNRTPTTNPIELSDEIRQLETHLTERDQRVYDLALARIAAGH